MAVYDEYGIRFQYPDNWTLDDAEAKAGERGVTVYSPGGSFWSVIWRDPADDAHELAVEALQTLKKEYPETEAEPANETVAGSELSGFDVSFYYLDLVNTAVIRSFRTPTAAMLVLCQADDREYREIDRVFQAMTISLLRADA